MIGFFKGNADKLVGASHHLGCGISGAVAFGFAAWLLDMGGLRTNASVTGHIDKTTLIAFGSVVLVFAVADVLMKRLTGKPGAF